MTCLAHAGPVAEEAVPVLIHKLDEANGDQGRYTVTWTLCKIMPDARTVNSVKLTMHAVERTVSSLTSSTLLRTLVYCVAPRWSNDVEGKEDDNMGGVRGLHCHESKAGMQIG